MYKIKFLKNNIEVQIDRENIVYDEESLVIKKESDDSVITLDFKNKKCILKIDDMILEIPVLFMDYKLSINKDIFSFTLESEPTALNQIIFHKKI